MVKGWLRQFVAVVGFVFIFYCVVGCGDVLKHDAEVVTFENSSDAESEGDTLDVFSCFALVYHDLDNCVFYYVEDATQIMWMQYYGEDLTMMREVGSGIPLVYSRFMDVSGYALQGP